jgi:hypothetical protein
MDSPTYNLVNSTLIRANLVRQELNMIEHSRCIRRLLVEVMVICVRM